MECPTRIWYNPITGLNKGHCWHYQRDQRSPQLCDRGTPTGFTETVWVYECCECKAIRKTPEVPLYD